MQCAPPECPDGTVIAQSGSVCPVDTFDSSPIDAYLGWWWLLHTKPRQEKALFGDLERRGISAYLPLARLQRQYGKRRTTVEIPLFPGYLFLCGTAEDRQAALTTNRIVRAIEVADQLRLVADLRRISRLVDSGEPIDVYPGLRVGRECRVTGGPLRGLRGVVLRRRSVSRMYMGVDILGQSAVVEIDCALLEAIE